jgi:N-acetyl-anhydromuramyl-L-alanine amidase AmpD
MGWEGSVNADYPGAIVVPAHPTNILRAVNRPKVLVLHTPEEPADNIEVTPYYFQRPNLGASTHYYADDDGDLYQMVPERSGAIANGVLGFPYPEGTDAGRSLNYQSLSIEIEGYAASIGQTMPRGGPQWRTVVAWVANRAAKYRIPIRRSRIIGHYEVANNRTDPGTLDIDAIVADAQEDDMVSQAEFDAFVKQQKAINEFQNEILVGQKKAIDLLAAIAVDHEKRIKALGG